MLVGCMMGIAEFTDIGQRAQNGTFGLNYCRLPRFDFRSSACPRVAGIFKSFYSILAGPDLLSKISIKSRI
ncbi:hypothetical protein ABKN59_007736 [Abortiporus biennis]